MHKLLEICLSIEDALEYVQDSTFEEEIENLEYETREAYRALKRLDEETLDEIYKMEGDGFEEVLRLVTNGIYDVYLGFDLDSTLEIIEEEKQERIEEEKQNQNAIQETTKKYKGR